MEYGCIGRKLGHSFSAEIHAALADYDYRLTELEPQEIEPFFRARQFRGINVTIPYKQCILPLLDVVDDCAAQIGAVNTVVNRDGVLYGYNTDYSGMRALLAHSHISLSGRHVYILGTGGTSHTARAVATAEGAASVTAVSRKPVSDGTLPCISYEEMYENASSVECIINTTPVGMYPNEDAAPVELSRLPALCGVADAVFNPLTTRLVRGAMARGIPSAGGLYMLVAQAARACELFLERPTAPDAVDRVYRELYRKKRNFVLVGMPGCGKTTLGARLAQTLGMEFLDCDALIEAEAGKSIPDIFREDGEEAFRRMESGIIRDRLSRCARTVIATGGGAVLRDENVRYLAQNGVLVFLDRDRDGLPVLSGRPLCRDPEAWDALYRERHPVYSAVSDVAVKCSADMEISFAALLAAVAEL